MAKRSPIRRASKCQQPSSKLDEAFYLTLLLTGIYKARPENYQGLPVFQICEINQVPSMMKEHMETRLQWEHRKICKSSKFYVIYVFSDEKNFNFGGPDGLACNWYDFGHTKMGRYRSVYGPLLASRDF